MFSIIYYINKYNNIFNNNNKLALFVENYLKL